MRNSVNMGNTFIYDEKKAMNNPVSVFNIICETDKKSMVKGVVKPLENFIKCELPFTDNFVSNYYVLQVSYMGLTQIKKTMMQVFDTVKLSKEEEYKYIELFNMAMKKLDEKYKDIKQTGVFILNDPETILKTEQAVYNVNSFNVVEGEMILDEMSKMEDVESFYDVIDILSQVLTYKGPYEMPVAFKQKVYTEYKKYLELDQFNISVHNANKVSYKVIARDIFIEDYNIVQKMIVRESGNVKRAVEIIKRYSDMIMMISE